MYSLGAMLSGQALLARQPRTHLTRTRVDTENTHVSAICSKIGVNQLNQEFV
jgi:hypothetical protein